MEVEIDMCIRFDCNLKRENSGIDYVCRRAFKKNQLNLVHFVKDDKY